MELVRQLSFSTVKAALPRARLAKRRGTAEQAAVYCQKDGNFLEHGVRSSAGARSDLHSVAASMIAGDSMSSIARANPEMFTRFHRGMWALRYITAPERSDRPEVRVYYGATDAGKSYTARQWLGDAPCYIHFSNQRGWFDGYQGEASCIFEEFRDRIFSWIKARLLYWRCETVRVQQTFCTGGVKPCAVSVIRVEMRGFFFFAFGMWSASRTQHRHLYLRHLVLHGLVLHQQVNFLFVRLPDCAGSFLKSVEILHALQFGFAFCLSPNPRMSFASASFCFVLLIIVLHHVVLVGLSRSKIITS